MENYYNQNLIYFTTDSKDNGNLKKYGVLYVRPRLPKGSRFEWLNFCALTNILPKDIQDGIRDLSKHINTTYVDYIVVPMDNRIITGCICLPEKVEEISKDIYDGMCKLFINILNIEDCVLLVYGTGMIHEGIIQKTKTIHEIDNYPIVVKVGQTLDNKSTGPGILKV